MAALSVLDLSPGSMDRGTKRRGVRETVEVAKPRSIKEIGCARPDKPPRLIGAVVRFGSKADAGSTAESGPSRQPVMRSDVPSWLHTLARPRERWLRAG
jgi:hypothetical protein